MKRQTGKTGWPSGKLDFHTVLPKVWGSMPMGKINLFVLPIFPVFAFKIMHRVTLLSRCCKLF